MLVLTFFTISFFILILILLSLYYYYINEHKENFNCKKESSTELDQVIASTTICHSKKIKKQKKFSLLQNIKRVILPPVRITPPKPKSNPNNPNSFHI